jgi:flagellar protein FliS
MVSRQPKYLEKEVFSANPAAHVVLLYNRAIALLKQILMAESEEDEVKRVKIRAEAFSKVVDILSYLKACLNFEKGGEIAKNLNEIYEVLIEELIRASIRWDEKPVRDSIEILEKLRDAFYAIGRA